MNLDTWNRACDFMHRAVCSFLCHAAFTLIYPGLLHRRTCIAWAQATHSWAAQIDIHIKNRVLRPWVCNVEWRISWGMRFHLYSRIHGLIQCDFIWALWLVDVRFISVDLSTWLEELLISSSNSDARANSGSYWPAGIRCKRNFKSELLKISPITLS